MRDQDARISILANGAAERPDTFSQIVQTRRSKPLDDGAGHTFSARCRDMSANGGVVDVVVTALGHRFGESDGDALPRGAPSPKAPIVPIAVLRPHIAPRRTVAVVFGRRPRPRLPSSRSTGNKTLKIRHSTSVRSPRLKAASSNLQP